jgi:hypothetical protein
MTDDRVATQIPALWRAGSFRGRGQVQNVSEGGLFLETLSIPEEGEAVEVTLQAPGKAEVEVRGLVWWTAAPGLASPCGFGLRVLYEDEGYQTLLHSVR